MSWSTAVLSTRTSVEKIEMELGSDSILTDAQVNNKIALAKTLIGNSTELYLTMEKEITVDESASEVLLNVIANPTVLSTASDYLVCSLIYEELSDGDDRSLYYVKAEKYHAYFETQFESAKMRFNIDRDLDGDIDIYRDSHVGVPLL